MKYSLSKNFKGWLAFIALILMIGLYLYAAWISEFYRFMPFVVGLFLGIILEKFLKKIIIKKKVKP